VLKRIIDLTVSIFGLLVLLPLFLLIAVLIKLDSKGSVFFKQQRVGCDGVLFGIFKFRTMCEVETTGRQITIGADPRITRVGAFLRKSKLDELAQLLNVLLGDMSLVGPRPEVPQYVKYYSVEEKLVLKLKPGITDLASIKYRYESEILAASDDPENTYINQVMRDKLKINLEYAQSASFFKDLRVILLTVKVLFQKSENIEL
jgi:lipopolysaccharide/colanic/teichoic acid biosynthesis glycosyltransferase